MKSLKPIILTYIIGTAILFTTLHVSASQGLTPDDLEPEIDLACETKDQDLLDKITELLGAYEITIEELCEEGE